VVTRALAERASLHTISELARVAPSLVLGGPPECPRRERCLVGLHAVYGLSFASFVPLAGSELVRRALDDGVIDVGVLFTTDAVLADDTVVALADDRALQPAENVVPLVRRDAVDARAAAALNDVGASLTTMSLRFLNWRVAHAGTSLAAEARGWLLRHRLISR
jgi:osmoprotectant transport system substrate-binding protein